MLYKRDIRHLGRFKRIYIYDSPETKNKGYFRLFYRFQKNQGWKKLSLFQPKTQRLGDFWGSSQKTQGWKKLSLFQPKTQRLGDFWGSSQKTQKKKLYIWRYLFGLMPLISFLCFMDFCKIYKLLCACYDSAFQSTNTCL